MLTYATEWTPEQLAAIVREQLTGEYSMADNLRTAVMFCPLGMTAKEFMDAAEANGVRRNTACNRYNEVRRQQREDLEQGIQP